MASKGQAVQARIERRIAVIIWNRLGFTNGWAVSSSRYEELCAAAAKDVLKYLNGVKQRREA